MHSLARGSRPNLSLLLFGLLIKCPFGNELAGCPFRTLRTVASLEEKYLLAGQLSTGELHQLLAAHQDCHRARLEGNLLGRLDRVAGQANSPNRGGDARQVGTNTRPANC